MELSVLAVGNSFAQDTFTWLPLVAKALKFEKIRVARLFQGGCSINMHMENLEKDLPNYTYAVWNGSQWTKQPHYKSKDAITDGTWD